MRRVWPVLTVGVVLALLASAGLLLSSNGGWLLTDRHPAAASPSIAPPEPLPGEVGLTLLAAPRPVPALAFFDAEGKPKTLADFKGRVVLLNIWATWCVPCRKEMPTLDRLQAKLGGPDFEVVALSIDRGGAPAVEAFFRDLGIERLAVYFDRTGNAARLLSVAGLPTTVLIDRSGQEIGRLIGEATWDRPELVSFIKGVTKGGSG